MSAAYLEFCFLREFLTCSKQTYCDCRAWYELHEGLAAYERERAAAGARIRLLALFELWVRREAGRETAAIRRRHCELDMVGGVA